MIEDESTDALTPGLDPEDWDQFRAIVHEAVDISVDFLRSSRERPAWKPVPKDIRSRILSDVPEEPQSLATLLREASEKILPYSVGNTHPRFFGWVHGTGLTSGLVAGLLEAAMNNNCGGRHHAAVYVEKAVLEWFRRLMGMPEGTSGLLVSGTSMATVVALAVAREKAISNCRLAGVGSRGGQLRVYASEETHGSIAKALELLGLGRGILRSASVDCDFRMDVESLCRLIREDVDAGLVPMAIVANAGTVNTGAVDPIEEIAAIAKLENIWLHVDGAFGALGVLSPEIAPLLQGLEQADSLAFDLHKWLFVEYAVGCVLVRDGALHKHTFEANADYLRHEEKGTAAEEHRFCDYGPELSREFLALRVWFAIREHGFQRLGAVIAKTCLLARRLASQIKANTQELELAVEPQLCIVCFRYIDHSRTGIDWDYVNKEIVLGLQEDGVAVPSMTRLNGRRMIRMSLTNHRTKAADIDLVVQEVIRRGRELSLSATAL